MKEFWMSGVGLFTLSLNLAALLALVCAEPVERWWRTRGRERRARRRLETLAAEPPQRAAVATESVADEGRQELLASLREAMSRHADDEIPTARSVESGKRRPQAATARRKRTAQRPVSTGTPLEAGSLRIRA